LKGQFNIEYIFSLIIFISVVTYISIEAANTIPQYHQRSLENRLYAETFMISDILLKDSRDGLAISPYELNSTKMIEFNKTCTTDYNVIKGELNLEKERDFQLMVFVNNSFNFVCGMKNIPSGITVILHKAIGLFMKIH